jgi:T-complex protein 1 subunit theta
MPLHLPQGIEAMLKEGCKHLQGLNEAVIPNLEACKNLGCIMRSSMGPTGASKVVINHLGKTIITKDSATIINELEIVHPAAKLLVMAAAAQQHEIGDGTNLIITLASELFSNAELLIRDGLHAMDIVDGYKKAFNETFLFLDTLVIPGSDQFHHMDEKEVIRKIKGVVRSKQFENETFDKLIARACINVCPRNPKNFSADSVRLRKIVGGRLEDSKVLKGMLMTRDTEGSIKIVKNAKVVVYAQGISISDPETKSTALLECAEDLWNYSYTEEERLEHFVEQILSTGVKVVVSGSSIQELSHHFLNKNKLMMIRITSKFELRRFCIATSSCALMKLRPPTTEEVGFAEKIEVCEFGSHHCTVLTQDASLCQLSSILIRGPTIHLLDDAERAIDDGINAYKILCRDARTLPAGGATEIEITKHLFQLAQKELGFEYYAIEKFAEALEVIPRTLVENSGHDTSAVMSSLWSAHMAGKKNDGVNLANGTISNLMENDIVDLYISKWWGFKLLCDVVVTVLTIDHIIIAKQASGPKDKNMA